MAELNAIASRASGKAQITVVVVEPKGMPESAEREDLMRLIGVIPTAHVVRDEGGREAEKFGVKTSGHTLVYSTFGSLVFSGGITSLRGHEGSNPASRAVLDHILHDSGEVSSSNVYGCPLSEEH